MRIDSRVDEIVRSLQISGAPISCSPNETLVERLEGACGFRIPKTFASLISRYSFPLLEFEGSELFGNNGQEEYDLATTPYRDKNLSGWLIRNNLFHIGFPHIGDYDPICLDLFSSPSADASVVKLNHEDILLGRDVKATVLSRSFLAFLGEQHVA